MYLQQAGVFFTQLMNNHYSIETKIHCGECSTTFVYSKVTLILYDGYSVNINNLGIDLYNYLHSHIPCSKCDSRTVSSHTVGSYLAIDVQKNNLSIFLNAIPIEIMIKDDTFLLVGLICYESEGDMKNAKNTYVAYTRSIKDVWTKYQSSKSKPTRIKRIPRVYVALIMYVKQAGQ